MSNKPKIDIDEVMGTQEQEETPKGPKRETYYDLLKVDPSATVPEIVAAYHQSKNAFSQDSVATYSLFNEDETKEMLNELEEAYLTLTNLERRAEYDHRLDKGLPHIQASPPSITELDIRKKLQATQNASPDGTPTGVPCNQAPTILEQVTGGELRKIRERLGLGLEDVARITKIPVRYLRGIECDEFKILPARVYLQGFITNLSNLYKLNPKETTKTYFEHYDLNAPRKD